MSGPRQLWRLLISENYGFQYTQVGRMELQTAVGESNLSVIGNGTATASSSYSGAGGPSEAFNASLDYYSGSWLSDTLALSTGGVWWLQWDFGASNLQAIKHLTLTNPTDASSSINNVKTAVLQYFDGSVWVNYIDVVNHPQTQSASVSYIRIDGSAALICPMQTVSASGTPTVQHGNINLSSPAGTLSAFGGANFVPILAPKMSLAAFGGATAALTGTFPTLLANGHDSAGENAFAGTAPMASLAFAGGGNAQLMASRPVLSASATFTNFGDADLTAPGSTLQASGTTGGAASANLLAPMASIIGYSGAVISVTTTDSPTLMASGTAGGIGSAALAAPIVGVIGYSGAVCSITLTGGLTLLATGSGGSIGKSAVICPLFELTANGTVNGLSSANLIAPSPRLIGSSSVAYLIAPGATLTAIGTAVVAVTYEAYSVNLTHKVRMQGEQPAIDEVTRYTNFPFTQIVRYQNSYFGVAADGLYLLEGTTDNGAPIAYAVKTAVDDFKEPQKKTIVSAYFAGRIGPTMTVTLHAGETGQNAYSYSTPRGAGIQNHREKFGRGVKDRYFAFGLSGTDVLEIDSIELEDNKLSRRI